MRCVEIIVEITTAGKAHYNCLGSEGAGEHVVAVLDALYVRHLHAGTDFACCLNACAAVERVLGVYGRDVMHGKRIVNRRGVGPVYGSGAVGGKVVVYTAQAAGVVLVEQIGFNRECDLLRFKGSS